MKTIACIIPARLFSSRFPRKILAPLQDKPLLQWAWEAACKVNFFDSVTIAVDAQETAEVVQTFGGQTIMTSPHWENGTFRICEIIKNQNISADIVVNWQADEPFINQHMIEDLLQSVDQEKSDIWTLKKKITNSQKIHSPHCVKVVCNHEGYALYFSRNPIPFKQKSDSAYYYQHIGLYAYTKPALLDISQLSLSALAQSEQLEQLNFLYHGMKIRVHETNHETLGIDTPEHLDQAHYLLASSALTKK